MKKKQSNKETPHEIIMDVRRKYSLKKKKNKKGKKGRLVETGIDLFAEEEKK